MTEASPEPQQQRTCNFPDCDKPREQPPGDGTPGRPPEYCVDPDHNRASSFAERRRRRLAAAGRPALTLLPVSDDTRPLDTARANLRVLVPTLKQEVDRLETLLSQATEELHTLVDPEALAVQVETIQSVADEKITAARTARLRAEEIAEQAETLNREATAAADLATTRLENLQVEHVTAQVQRDQATALNQELTGQLTERTGELEEALARARNAEGESERLTQTLAERNADLLVSQNARAAAEQQVKDLIGDRDRQRARADQLAVRENELTGQVSSLTAQLAERTNELTGLQAVHHATTEDLATQRAKAGELSGQLATATAQVAAEKLRAEDLKDRLDREEKARQTDRAAAAAEAARLGAERDTARGQVAERNEELARERAERGAAREEVARLNAEIADVRGDLQEQERLFTAQGVELAGERTERAVAQRAVDGLTERLRQSTAEAVAEREAAAAAQQAIAVAEAQAQAARDLVAALREQYEARLAAAERSPGTEG